MHKTEKFTGASNQLSIYISPYSHGHGDFENLSMAERVMVQHLFAYIKVDLNKIIIVPFAKPSSYMNVQFT